MWRGPLGLMSTSLLASWTETSEFTKAGKNCGPPPFASTHPSSIPCSTLGHRAVAGLAFPEEGGDGEQAGRVAGRLAGGWGRRAAGALGGCVRVGVWGCGLVGGRWVLFRGAWGFSVPRSVAQSPGLTGLDDDG